jgi:hypothetical protein
LETEVGEFLMQKLVNPDRQRWPARILNGWRLQNI